MATERTTRAWFEEERQRAAEGLRRKMGGTSDARHRLALARLADRVESMEYRRQPDEPTAPAPAPQTPGPPPGPMYPGQDLYPGG